MPPVGQIAKGVFVVAPGNVETYKDTVGGGYVSAFTKARADQWELSLKEAASKVQNAEQRFKYQMDAYQERLAELERRRAQAAIDIDKFNADAANAAKEFNAKGEAERQQDYNKLSQRRAELEAKLTYVEPGGTRTSIRTTDGGGGGTAADKAAKYKANENETKVLTDAVAGKQGSIPAAIADFKAKSETLLSGATPERSMAIRKGIVDELIKDAATRQNKSIQDPQLKERVLDEVNAVDPGLVTDYLDVDDAIEQGGAAGKTVTTATSVAGKVARRAYGQIAAPTMAELAPIEAEQIDKEKALAAYDTTLATLREARPDLPETDLIYSARRLMQKNFGPTRSAQESAFDQRRVLDMLLRASPEQRAGILARYKQMAPSAPTVSGEATPVANEPAAPVTPPPAAPTDRSVSPDVTAGIRSLRAGDVPPDSPVDLSGIAPGTAADTTAQSKPFVSPDRPSDIASRMVGVDFKTSADKTKAPFDNEQLLWKSKPYRGVPGGIFTGPEMDKIEAAKFDAYMKFREESKRKYDEEQAKPWKQINDLDEQGRQARREEIMTNFASATPSVSKTPSISRLTAGDPESYGLDPEQATRGMFNGLDIQPRERTSLENKLLIARNAELAGGPKEGPSVGFNKTELKTEAPTLRRPPTSPAIQTKDAQIAYLQGRYTAAKDLVDQPNKLGRLTASGPGLDAKKLWTSNKDLKSAFDELTLKYTSDPSKRELAHTILIAIDLASKKTTEIPKAGE